MKDVPFIYFCFFATHLFSCTYDIAKIAPSKKTFDCNAQSITYNSHIKNILNQSCALACCHIGTNSSGIVLDTYTSAKTEFQLGNSFCTINFGNGCKPMPYPIGTAKLSDSIIQILNCWKDKGFPN